MAIQMIKYTVIGFYEDNQQISVHLIKAKTPIHAANSILSDPELPGIVVVEVILGFHRGILPTDTLMREVVEV